MNGERGYGQYCGMSRGAEIFATPWTPIIVRNLLVGCRTFTQILEGAPGLSRTLLTQRLGMLIRRGIVERVDEPPTGYRLTEAGEALRPVVTALGVWGERWMELAPEHFDAGLVLWGLTRLLPADLLPARRVVVRVEVPDDVRRRFWLLADSSHLEVCAKPPAPSDDLVLTSESEWLTRWHTGELSLRRGIRDGVFTVDGPRGLVRMLDSWGGHGRWSPAEPATRR